MPKYKIATWQKMWVYKMFKQQTNFRNKKKFMITTDFWSRIGIWGENQGNWVF